MSTRGQGRVYQRAGSPFWYVAYYAHGKEQRETACAIVAAQLHALSPRLSGVLKKTRIRQT